VPLRSSSTFTALGIVLLLMGNTLSAQDATSMIHGAAQDTDGSMLPSAPVQLRNLESNKVELISRSNQRGEFNFAAHPETPYVVEIADRTGQIIAVGEVVVPHAGEVAGTIVAIPTRLSAQSIFGQTAGSVVSAATGAGITVLGSAAVPQPLPPTASPEK
jgi:hypothetical protein